MRAKRGGDDDADDGDDGVLATAANGWPQRRQKVAPSGFS
jgi:hypothetical protein